MIETVLFFGWWSMQLSLISVSSGSAIPRRFTCDGEDLSPPLDWRAVPLTTRSLVLLCDDPDAPTGKWHHWAAYDIEADQMGLAEGAGHGSGAAGFRQAINDFHRAGYGGPCPPRGHGRHRYHFRLLALSVDHLSLGARPSCNDVEREARWHVIAEASQHTRCAHGRASAPAEMIAEISRCDDIRAASWIRGFRAIAIWREERVFNPLRTLTHWGGDEFLDHGPARAFLDRG